LDAAIFWIYDLRFMIARHAARGAERKSGQLLSGKLPRRPSEDGRIINHQS
jgi:hypothetical protein